MQIIKDCTTKTTWGLEAVVWLTARLAYIRGVVDNVMPGGKTRLPLFVNKKNGISTQLAWCLQCVRRIFKILDAVLTRDLLSFLFECLLLSIQSGHGFLFACTYCTTTTTTTTNNNNTQHTTRNTNTVGYMNT